MPRRTYQAVALAEASQGIGLETNISASLFAEASATMMLLNGDVFQVAGEAEAVCGTVSEPFVKAGSVFFGAIDYKLEGAAEALTQWDALSATGGAIDIYDEGVLVKNNVSCLNFIGADILAQNDGDCVGIYVPPPSFVSHWNSTDGINNALVGSVSTTTRYVSSPTSEGTPFHTGGWAGTQHPCLRNTSLSWSAANECSFADETTTFDITITGPQGVIHSFTTAAINANGSYSDGAVDVSISNWQEDSIKFSADVSVQIDIDSILPNSGRCEVDIVHNNSTDGVFTFNQSAFFYDSQSAVAVISALTSAMNTAIIKQISGISYLTTGTSFDFGIGDIDNLNNESFPLNQISLSLTSFAIPNESLRGTDLTDWTNAYDNQNASWAGTRSISIANQRVCGTGSVFSATPQDWSAGTQQNASALPCLIDTYTDNATNGSNTTITENFYGESLRVHNDGSTWDSSVSLSADDLMVSCGGLSVQSSDWSAFLPHNGTSVINPDYSVSGATSQYFYRFYTTGGLVKSAGTFTFTGLTEAALSSDDVLIDFSLNATDWFSLNNDFMGGTLIDGAGARTNSGTVLAPNIEFTLSTYATVQSSGIVPANSIMLRITMKSTYSGQITTAHLNWL
jgi:hypothetical protein